LLAPSGQESAKNLTEISPHPPITNAAVVVTYQNKQLAQSVRSTAEADRAVEEF